MAKATPVELDPAEPFGRAARAIVRVRAADMWAAEDGVLDTSDIERVHAMRVATRRLRAVLEIFRPAFEPGPFKDVLRDVKRLADALGERRDPDVHLEAMRDFAAGVRPAEAPGIESLIGDLERRQTAGNATVAAALRRVEESGLRARLDALAADPPEDGA